jgi:sugar phosphate isomerase/epimerase
MHRRTFLVHTSGLIISVAVGSNAAPARSSIDDRLGMSSVTFRNRFQQTKPTAVTQIKDELTLLKVPEYYRDRFGIRNLEFWGHHFESLEEGYLKDLRARVETAGAQVINVQADAEYDLASANEEERQQSLKVAFRWVDAARVLGSRAVRINPGRAGGSIERSIASMKEVNRYCKSKGLPLLIENHFGLEMDPDVHLRVRQGAGPENVYTLPDFGNYPIETMWESLAKVLPYAYLVSAKTVEFNDRTEHVSYDFDRCVQLAERSGFKGIYSVEQWSREDLTVDPEKVVDWMLQHVRANLRQASPSG